MKRGRAGSSRVVRTSWWEWPVLPPEVLANAATKDQSPAAARDRVQNPGLGCSLGPCCSPSAVPHPSPALVLRRAKDGPTPYLSRLELYPLIAGCSIRESTPLPRTSPGQHGRAGWWAQESWPQGHGFGRVWQANQLSYHPSSNPGLWPAPRSTPPVNCEGQFFRTKAFTG